MAENLCPLVLVRGSGPNPIGYSVYCKSVKSVLLALVLSHPAQVTSPYPQPWPSAITACSEGLTRSWQPVSAGTAGCGAFLGWRTKLGRGRGTAGVGPVAASTPVGPCGPTQWPSSLRRPSDGHVPILQRKGMNVPYSEVPPGSAGRPFGYRCLCSLGSIGSCHASVCVLLLSMLLSV